jgi:hypothetical protein
MSWLKSEEKIQILDLFGKGKSCKEIALIFNKTPSAIVKFINRNNIKFNLSKVHQKYPIDESFFENIDSPEKAYFLGWFVTDGSNGKGNCIAISLQENDKYILEVLKKIIKTDRPLIFKRAIKYKNSKENSKNQYSLTFYNKKISNDLLNLGYNNKKSYNLIFPSFLKEELIPHFLRGAFEGDGCICIHKNGYIIFICGTLEFCKGISSYLNTKKIINKISKSGSIWRIEIIKNKINKLKFLELIYDNSGEMKLLRKYDKYLIMKNK